ncbi:MAG: tRNA 2-thiocytidine(32) synthetase TtcA [Lachnospiraceae bacterium]|jgi:tRNA(Ile)-lysidine synthase TilS/MesJ|nr:tRNA 2-thiocytidine(32) synthetase TtcA [Lachnospiraceae bacterium]
MTLQKVMSQVRRALDDYHMITDNDRIAVGISGGKDSLTLLLALHGLMRFYPKPFTLHAVTVDLGFDNLDLDKIQELCNKIEIPYTIVKTQIAEIVFEGHREENPCSLCAKLRKGAFNNAIKKEGCNKIAYAHHRDDMIATMFLSLLYEGRFQALEPVTYLEKSGLTLIRPLLYMRESDVVGFTNKAALPVVKSPCPADGKTRRKYVEELLRRIDRENPGAKNRIFTAIENGWLDNWK